MNINYTTNSHLRGAIDECKDFGGDTFFKVYTGDEHCDQFYTTDDWGTAVKIQRELLERV